VSEPVKRCVCSAARWSRCTHPWWIRVSAGRDSITRKRRYLTATVYGDRASALRRRRDLQGELDRRRDGDREAVRQTLAAYLPRYLESVSIVSKRGGPLAPTTRRRYADAIGRIGAVVGGVKLADLEPDHVEHLRDELLAEGLAPQTVADVLRVLSQALRRAVAKGWLERNPADPDLVNRPAGKPKPLPVITPELAGTILEAVRATDPWDVAAHLALGITLRREEVLGLTWPDVDFDAGRLTVSRTLTWADGESHEGGPKSGAGERTIDLPGFVVEGLRRHRVAQGARRLIVGEAWHLGEFVVDRGDGRPWSPPSFSKGWSRFAERHGFGDVTFHGLRHGAATLLLAAGVPDPVAAQIMGHADTRILRRYQDVVPALRREAAERMEVLLGGARQ
jgi:integrase